MLELKLRSTTCVGTGALEENGFWIERVVQNDYSSVCIFRSFDESHFCLAAIAVVHIYQFIVKDLRGLFPSHCTVLI